MALWLYGFVSLAKGLQGTIFPPSEVSTLQFAKTISRLHLAWSARYLSSVASLCICALQIELARVCGVAAVPAHPAALLGLPPCGL